MTRQEKEGLLREAVEILIKLDNHMMTSRDNAEFSQWIEDLIEQPQQRTGHWTKDEITERARVAYKHKCDLCGAYHRAMYNYCPSCGAKMQ